MGYGKPKHVKPWLRANWPRINRGNKLYAIQEWQCYCIRNKLTIDELPADVAKAINKPRDYISAKAEKLRKQNNVIIPESDEDAESAVEEEHGVAEVPQPTREPYRPPSVIYSEESLEYGVPQTTTGVHHAEVHRSGHKQQYIDEDTIAGTQDSVDTLSGSPFHGFNDAIRYLHDHVDDSMSRSEDKYFLDRVTSQVERDIKAIEDYGVSDSESSNKSWCSSQHSAASNAAHYKELLDRGPQTPSAHSDESIDSHISVHSEYANNQDFQPSTQVEQAIEGAALSDLILRAYKKDEICFHVCNKKIHLFVNNA